MNIKLLSGSGTFGRQIRNINILDADQQALNDLKELLYRHRLLVIKNQRLDEKEFCEFAEAFGEPVPYLQENYRHPDFPLIFVSSNVKDKGRKIGVARTGGYWHSDTAFEPDPKYITMLMPKILPPLYPRATLFIDMAEVYAALPLRMRQRLMGKTFIHSGRWRYKVRPEDAGKDIHEILQWIDDFAPPVRHPGVIVHPWTGEKIVYGTRGFTVGVAGETLDESARLLADLFDFAEQERFVRRVQWAPGDVIVWDNRYLAHKSDRNEGPEEATVMHRITLKDGLPLSAVVSRGGEMAPARTLVEAV